MTDITIRLFIVLLFLVGIVILQIYLSKKENRFLGLVLPAISFIFSLVAISSIALFSAITGGSETIIYNEQGQVIERIQNAAVSDQERPGLGAILATATPIFLLANIPTIILLAIYGACREQNRRKNELNKMNVQDLD